MALSAPFPWMGGKSRAAHLIWERFGRVTNYVEPFAGSLAVLLGRPEGWTGSETVNDKDGFIANFWRALAADPEGVADDANWPVNEVDQHARHAWLVKERATLTARLEGDPEFYDRKIAGWWVWGLCCWIGSGWCSGNGPWQSHEGQLIHVGDAGLGVHRQLIHVGDAGRGVHRQLIHVGDAGQGEWFAALADRLRRVRVACGDWARVCGPSVTVKHGVTAVLLDPPYGEESECTSGLYAVDSKTVAADVRAWAIQEGNHPDLRIALCGYDGAYTMPGTWQPVRWKAKGGYGSQGTGQARANARRETIWFSPHCDHPHNRLNFEMEESA